jgi:hypothetical protein
MAGYDDGRVACTDQEIVIRHYYPLGSKRIKYQDIREVRVTPLGGMGRWPEQVTAELAAHGVNVTTGREVGLW